MHPTVRALGAVVLAVAVFVSGPGMAAAVVAGGGHPVSDASQNVEWVDGDPDEIDGTVVVRLESPDSVAEDDREATIEALEAHAQRTQADVVTWAERADGIEVRSQFWLVNAVTLSVDPDADLEPLEEFATVEAVHESFEVERADPVAVDRVEDGGDDGTGHDGTGADDGGGDGEHPSGDADRASDGGDSASAPDVTYGLDLIDVPAAREQFDATGEGATVAVLDTGVEAAHPDLDVEQFQEFDAAGNHAGSEPTDHSPQGHGTHASGTVAGGDASGTAIGVAPEADLAVGAVLTECQFGGCGGTFEQIIAGMEWAVADAEADVLSMILGVGGRADRMIEPVRNARAAGTVVVAASGNTGEDASGSPGNVHETVAVGAVDDGGQVAGFSGGEHVLRSSWSNPPDHWPAEYVVPTVAAPGVDVYSAQGSDGYAEKSGTSMAAPHVAGVAALVAGAADADPDEIERAIESTATKPDDAPGPPGDRDVRYGAGIVDAEAALEAALQEDPIPAVGAVGDRGAEGEVTAGPTPPPIGELDEPFVAGIELGRREPV